MSIPKPNHPSGETITGTWRLDSQRSSIGFRVGHFWGLVKVNGHFGDYRGQLNLGADPAVVELTIEAASVQTGNRKRDQHLRSAAFFDAESHPQVQFLSDSVVLSDDALEVHGRLSARGRSIPLELKAQIRRVDEGLTIEAVATAPHRELGMTYSPLGMIRPRTELLVNAYVTHEPEAAA